MQPADRAFLDDQSLLGIQSQALKLNVSTFFHEKVLYKDNGYFIIEVYIVTIKKWSNQRKLIIKSIISFSFFFYQLQIMYFFPEKTKRLSIVYHQFFYFAVCTSQMDTTSWWNYILSPSKLDTMYVCLWVFTYRYW